MCSLELNVALRGMQWLVLGLCTFAAAGEAVKAQPKLPVESDGFEFIVDDFEHERDAQKIEKLSMLDILDALKTSTPEHLKESVDKTADFKNLFIHPVKFRGHVVSFDGTFRYKYDDAFDFDGENGTKITLSRGQISSRGNLISVASLEPFPAGLKGGDTVRFTGIFMKRLAYINDHKPGVELTWTPLIFVQRLEPYKEEEPSTNTAVFVGYIVFLMVGIGFFFMYNSKKEASVRRSNYFRQMKAQRDGGGTLFPGPGSAKKK